MKLRKTLKTLLWVVCFACFHTSAAYSTETYMSLRSNKVYMRVGPSKIYPVIWVYVTRGIPLQIIGKNNEWLQVQDKDGETGWIYYRLLSKVRTAITTSNNVFLHTHPDNNADLVARLMKHVVVLPLSCRSTWCYVTVLNGTTSIKGWVRRQYIWGIDPSDVFEEE
jgi:SH3-like domain-containing protein